MHKQHSTTVTDTVAGKQCMVHAFDRKFPRWQVNNTWYTRPTVTDTMAGKQAYFDQSIATDRYSACRCLQSEIKMKNGKHKRVIPTLSIVNGQA